MQQTNKYKFNLIETTDAFSPNPLNDNAKKLEDALITHEAAVDSALKSQKMEWQAAHNDLKAADAALAQTVAAVEKGAYFFKLGETAAVADNQAVTFSLSGLKLTQYAALLLITGGTGNAFSVNLAVNGTIIANIVSASGAGTGANYHGACIAALIPAGHSVVLTGINGGIRSSGMFGGTSGGTLGLTWASITQLQFTGSIPAGTGFIVYGIKK